MPRSPQQEAGQGLTHGRSCLLWDCLISSAQELNHRFTSTSAGGALFDVCLEHDSAEQRLATATPRYKPRNLPQLRTVVKDRQLVNAATV